MDSAQGNDIVPVFEWSQSEKLSKTLNHVRNKVGNKWVMTSEPLEGYCQGQCNAGFHYWAVHGSLSQNQNKTFYVLY